MTTTTPAATAVPAAMMTTRYPIRSLQIIRSPLQPPSRPPPSPTQLPRLPRPPPRPPLPPPLPPPFFASAPAGGMPYVGSIVFCAASIRSAFSVDSCCCSIVNCVLFPAGSKTSLKGTQVPCAFFSPRVFPFLAFFGGSEGGGAVSGAAEEQADDGSVAARSSLSPGRLATRLVDGVVRPAGV